MVERRRSLGWRLALLLAVVASVVVVVLALHRPAAEPNHRGMSAIVRRDQIQPLDPAAATFKGALRIGAGVHLENAYNLSIPDQTFMADGWYWIDWPPEVQELMEAHDIEADQMVEVVNNIIGYDFEVEPEREKPELRADGWRHQRYRFSGSFYVDDLDLHDSPFNLLSLPLILETRPVEFALDGKTPVLLIPEPDKQGLLGAYASIKGFQEIGVSFEPMLHRYTTNFGESDTRRDYAQAVLRVFYRSPLLASFALWIVPLLIVMSIVFMAPSLEGSLGDLRIAIPSTALLTLVVLQQTYQAEIPPLPYLTFLDKLYLYCYLVSIALFLLFVWGSNVYSNASEAQRDRLTHRVDRADTWFQVSALVGTVVAASLAWITG
jgi:hypothetical protein